MKNKTKIFHWEKTALRQITKKSYMYFDGMKTVPGSLAHLQMGRLEPFCCQNVFPYSQPIVSGSKSLFESIWQLSYERNKDEFPLEQNFVHPGYWNESKVAAIAQWPWLLPGLGTHLASIFCQRLFVDKLGPVLESYHAMSREYLNGNLSLIFYI